MAAVAGALIVLGATLASTAEGYGLMLAPGAVASLPTRWLRVHRMRAYDQTLLRDVYWDSGSIDIAGDDYTGPGPLQGVVVSKVFEAQYDVC